MFSGKVESGFCIIECKQCFLLYCKLSVFLFMKVLLDLRLWHWPPPECCLPGGDVVKLFFLTWKQFSDLPSVVFQLFHVVELASVIPSFLQNVPDCWFDHSWNLSDRFIFHWWPPSLALTFICTSHRPFQWKAGKCKFNTWNHLLSA